MIVKFTGVASKKILQKWKRSTYISCIVTDSLLKMQKNNIEFNELFSRSANKNGTKIRYMLLILQKMYAF